MFLNDSSSFLKMFNEEFSLPPRHLHKASSCGSRVPNKDNVKKKRGMYLELDNHSLLCRCCMYLKLLPSAHVQPKEFVSRECERGYPGTITSRSRQNSNSTHMRGLYAPILVVCGWQYCCSPSRGFTGKPAPFMHSSDESGDPLSPRKVGESSPSRKFQRLNCRLTYHVVDCI